MARRSRPCVSVLTLLLLTYCFFPIHATRHFDMFRSHLSSENRETLCEDFKECSGCIGQGNCGWCADHTSGGAVCTQKVIKDAGPTLDGCGENSSIIKGTSNHDCTGNNATEKPAGGGLMAANLAAAQVLAAQTKLDAATKQAPAAAAAAAAATTAVAAPSHVSQPAVVAVLPPQVAAAVQAAAQPVAAAAQPNGGFRPLQQTAAPISQTVVQNVGAAPSAAPAATAATTPQQAPAPAPASAAAPPQQQQEQRTDGVKWSQFADQHSTEPMVKLQPGKGYDILDGKPGQVMGATPH